MYTFPAANKQNPQSTRVHSQPQALAAKGHQEDAARSVSRTWFPQCPA